MKRILLMEPITLLIVTILIAFNASADTQLYFIHNDHLGTPQVVTDVNQTVVWEGNKKPFGETEETIATIDQQTRFPGQYFDEESGLYYNYFRDYDPSLGRYIQSDPIGILRDYSDPQLQVAIQHGLLSESGAAGEYLNHNYGYVGQNPLYWIDPLGLAEHTSNQSPSNKSKHESGNARRNRDGGGEKGDRNRRPPNKKPPGHKGPWPVRIPVIVLPYNPEHFQPIDPYKDIPKDC